MVKEKEKFSYGERKKMDFRFSEEEELFQSTVRKFCAQEVAPIVEEYEEREEFPVFLFQIL